LRYDYHNFAIHNCHNICIFVHDDNAVDRDFYPVLPADNMAQEVLPDHNDCKIPGDNQRFRLSIPAFEIPNADIGSVMK